MCLSSYSVSSSSSDACERMICVFCQMFSSISTWAHCLGKLIEKLRNEKIQIAALEKIGGAIDLKKYKPIFPLALILGNEVEGIVKSV